MSADTFGNARAKARYVLEIRYDPVLGVFDRRGAIVREIFSAFKKKVKHWKIGNVQINMADDFAHPTKLIDIGHMASRILYEDPATRQEFLDDSHRFVEMLFDHVFQGNTPEVQRIGFRTMSVFNHATAASFEETFDDIGKRFLAANLPWSLDFADVSMTLTRKDARIFLGPVKEEEDWIKATFSLPSENMPPYGIGLDVDGFANVIKNSGKKAVLSTVRTLQEFVQTTEEETLKGMV